MLQLLFLILLAAIIAAPIAYFCNFLSNYSAPYESFMNDFNTYTEGARYKITFEQFLKMYNEIKKDHILNVSDIGIRCYNPEVKFNKWHVYYNEDAYAFSFSEYRKYLDWLHKTIEENISEVQDLTKSK